MTSKTTTGAKQVDSYLARLAAPQRETLVVVRDRLRSILPHASEGMKYGNVSAMNVTRLLDTSARTVP